MTRYPLTHYPRYCTVHVEAATDEAISVDGDVIPNVGCDRILVITARMPLLRGEPIVNGVCRLYESLKEWAEHLLREAGAGNILDKYK